MIWHGWDAVKVTNQVCEHRVMGFLSRRMYDDDDLGGRLSLFLSIVFIFAHLSHVWRPGMILYQFFLIVFLLEIFPRMMIREGFSFTVYVPLSSSIQNCMHLFTIYLPSQFGINERHIFLRSHQIQWSLSNWINV
jgi:hypothetical protein